MKSKTFTTLLVSAFFAVLLYSCGGNNASKMLVKKWQFESLKSDKADKQLAAIKQQMDTTKDSTMKALLTSSMKMMTEGMESMKGVTMEFKADGSAETTMGGPSSTTEKANWSLTADNKKLVISRDGGKKADTMDIKELTSDKLVFSMGPDGTMSWTAVK